MNKSTSETTKGEDRFDLSLLANDAPVIEGSPEHIAIPGNVRVPVLRPDEPTPENPIL